MGLPKDEFSEVPLSSISTPKGLATLAAAGDADMLDETVVGDTSTLSERELRKQADNRNEAGRARFELMKALEATNSKGQPGGTLGKRYAESDDNLRMVDAQRYVESLIKGDPYSGELSPSQTARNQKTLSDTLRREEMQRQRDAIERQGMESQEAIARENARGNALAALGEIDRSSEPALFRQKASIAGERQANALPENPAMFGDMPFNATSDEAAKTDPMQMTDTEIRNASQGLIPYDMSMAADGAQDPKPITIDSAVKPSAEVTNAQLEAFTDAAALRNKALTVPTKPKKQAADNLQATAIADVAKVTTAEPDLTAQTAGAEDYLRRQQENKELDAEAVLDAERAAGLTAGENAFTVSSPVRSSLDYTTLNKTGLGLVPSAPRNQLDNPDLSYKELISKQPRDTKTGIKSYTGSAFPNTFDMDNRVVTSEGIGLVDNLTDEEKEAHRSRKFEEARKLQEEALLRRTEPAITRAGDMTKVLARAAGKEYIPELPVVPERALTSEQVITGVDNTGTAVANTGKTAVNLAAAAAGGGDNYFDFELGETTTIPPKSTTDFMVPSGAGDANITPSI